MLIAIFFNFLIKGYLQLQKKLFDFLAVQNGMNY